MKFMAPLEHRAMLADQRERPLLQAKLRGVSRSGLRAARRRGGRRRRSPRRGRTHIAIIAPVAGRDHPPVEVEDALQLGAVECGNRTPVPRMRERRHHAQALFDLRLRAGARRSKLGDLACAAPRSRSSSSASRRPRGIDNPRRTACRRERSPGCSAPCRPAPAWPGCRPSSRPAHVLGDHRLAPILAPSPTLIGPSTCAPEPMMTPDRKRRVALAADAGGRVGAAQRDVLVDGDVVADLGGLADHGEAMVDEEVRADLRAGMDVDRGQQAREMVDQPREEIELARRTASARRGGEPSAQTPG